MEPRRTWWRLPLCAAALVTLVSVTSGCGGGSDPQVAAKSDPPLVEYSNAFLTFSHAASWQAYPFRWPGELHFRPMVYLSTQPVHNPCRTQGNTTSCGFPIERLEPGGVLVTWQQSGIPALTLGDGTPTRVGGKPARRTDAAGTVCPGIGADRAINVLIETRPLPAPLTEFTACLRGPGLAQHVASVDALLASTRFASG